MGDHTTQGQAERTGDPFFERHQSESERHLQRPARPRTAIDVVLVAAGAMTVRNQRITLLSLSALVGLTRFIPLSRGPWDWDEILFCIAVGDYNVAAHQPHPAGFPLFILLGKIARFVADSDFHALQAVNVIASLFVFPLMYAVARAFRLAFIA